MAATVSPEYLESLRRTPGEQKLRTAGALYRAARKLKSAAVREQHPDWTEARVALHVRHIFLHAGD